ncbi:MAG: DUF559 domain-containing protein [Sandaracinaceae bacterium]|nr:DUF559 domain-containing protein [Sandaracinaceae bacterium]
MPVKASSATRLRKSGSLAGRHPDIAREWDEARNGIPASMITPASSSRAHWTCQTCGHEWQATVANRTGRGSGCPPCARARRGERYRQAVIDKRGHLAEGHPEIAAEWDRQGNPGGPEDVSPGSDRKVAWTCRRCDHRWTATVSSRVHGSGCPACAPAARSKRRRDTLVRKGGSLADHHPALAAEWDAVRNPQRASEVTLGSSVRGHWMCSACGRRWQATVASRVERGGHCPTCNRRQGAERRVNDLLRDRESLAQAHPHIAAELDDPEVDASRLLVHSEELLRWRCATCSHQWTASVASRTRTRTHYCPACSRTGTSYVETLLLVESWRLWGRSRVRHQSAVEGFEVDIAVPHLHLAIEVDGYWHAKEGKVAVDVRKGEALKRAGWTVVRLRMGDLPRVDDGSHAFAVSRNPDDTELIGFLRWLADITGDVRARTQVAGPLLAGHSEARALLREHRFHTHARLTAAQVLDVRTRFAEGGIALNQLAAEHGCSAATIQHAVRGQTYKTAGGPIAGRDYDPSELERTVPRNAVFKSEDVLALRQSYSLGQTTMNGIAVRYGVSTGVVERTLKGRSHAEAGGPILGRDYSNRDVTMRRRSGGIAVRGATQLTAEEAVAIRDAFAQERASYAALAGRFGTTPSNIRSIVTGTSWRHAGGPTSASRRGRRPSE